jgi:pimeloyl-ACP methyl ester carboxylesterase
VYRLGVKLVSYDRPGYGGSDRLEGRSVADAAYDVAEIARQLGIDDGFGVVGRSGGGPHALAAAALCENVSSVATLVSLAPYDGGDLDWYSGMNAYNRREFMAVDAETQALLDRLAGWAADAKRDPHTMIEMLRAELSESDDRVVGDVGLRALLLQTYREGLRNGADGWIDDVLAVRSPWKFQLSEVTCPAYIWHGEDDRFSPVEHSAFLFRELGTDEAEKHLQIEQQIGHFGAVETLPRILAWVVGNVQAKANANRA